MLCQVKLRVQRHERKIKLSKSSVAALERPLKRRHVGTLPISEPCRDVLLSWKELLLLKEGFDSCSMAIGQGREKRISVSFSAKMDPLIVFECRVYKPYTVVLGKDVKKGGGRRVTLFIMLLEYVIETHPCLEIEFSQEAVLRRAKGSGIGVVEHVAGCVLEKGEFR